MASDLKRFASIAGAALISLLGFALSLGAILGALLGIWLLARWARRRDRQPSAVAELVVAVGSATLLAGLLWSALLAAAPKFDREEFRAAMKQQQAKPVKMPDWYTKAFPQTAQMDSATQVFSDSVTRKLAQSDAFPTVVMVFGVLMLAMMFGGVGGVTGWGARRLFRVAFDSEVTEATRKDQPPQRM